MNIFQAISGWKQERNEKMRADMEAMGKCPNCMGRGFISTFASIYTPSLHSVFDCPGCQGSGQFNEWNSDPGQIQ